MLPPIASPAPCVTAPTMNAAPGSGPAVSVADAREVTEIASALATAAVAHRQPIIEERAYARIVSGEQRLSHRGARHARYGRRAALGRWRRQRRRRRPRPGMLATPDRPPGRSH